MAGYGINQQGVENLQKYLHEKISFGRRRM